MTPQEIFTKAYEHILKQGACSVGPQGNCAYRGDEGRFCAAGIFMSDAVALKADQMMNSSISHVIQSFGSRLPKWFIEYRALIREMQIAHDDMAHIEKGYSPELWTENMKSVANRFNLKMPTSIAAAS